MDRFRVLAALLLVSIVLAACSGGIPNTGTAVRVGSKNTPEDILVAEMYADVLEAQGIPVQRRLNLSSTQTVHAALITGEVDVYPEYTGTAYLTIMGMNDGEKDPLMQYDKIMKYYERRWKITWLTPSPLNNNSAIAVTQDAANRYNLKTISDLVRNADKIRFAATPDFATQPGGLAAIQQAYGEVKFKEMNLFDPSLKYQAMQNQQGDAVIANSTDRQIKSLHLVLLQDDRHAWPPSHLVPVVRDETLQKYPAMKDPLNALSAALNNQVMMDLNNQVQVENKDYAQVAKDFLRGQGLLK